MGRGEVEFLPMGAGLGKQPKDPDVQKHSWVSRLGAAGCERLQVPGHSLLKQHSLCCKLSPFCPCTQTGSSGVAAVTAGHGCGISPPAAGRAQPLACIVLSSKVKKPAKKQPSELSRKPNQKEKRGRAEEKPRNKSAPPPAALSLGTALSLCCCPAHPLGADRAPMELPRASSTHGGARSLPCCLLELEGLEEVLGDQAEELPCWFPSPRGRCLGHHWGFALLQSRGAGPRGSCCLRALLPGSWDVCVASWQGSGVHP